MKIYRVDYNQYNITLNIGNKDILIATIRRPLMRNDFVDINMYFPYDECSGKRIYTTYLTEEAMLEKAKHIIIKKLYVIHNNIIDGIKNELKINNEVYRKKYTVCDNFMHGDVYAAKQW